MRIKTIVLAAAFLAAFFPASAAESITYNSNCKAWRPDGLLVHNGFCEVTMDTPGIRDLVSYTLKFRGIEIMIQNSEYACQVNGKSCVAYSYKYRKALRFVSEDGSIFEFTSSPQDSF